MYQILIADDDKVSQTLLKVMIEDRCELTIVSNGLDAYKNAIGEQKFDLIFLDINMPGLNGYEVCKKIKQHNQLANIPIIFISGNREDDDVIKGLELGAVDYIKKPFKSTIVRARLQTHLKLKQYQDDLECQVAERTKKLLDAKESIRQSQEETIYRLTKAVEFRDNETSYHTLRMAHYCKILTRHSSFSEHYSEQIRIAAQLHDVGKIGISDTILQKPGKLTKEEFEIIKQHTSIGWRILSDSDSDMLNMGAIIAHTHHEKFNGTGYPLGLKGTDIPKIGRIAAICDVFDALTTDRVYKKAISVDKSLVIMKAERGFHFDPELFDAFEECMPQILIAKNRFIDQ